jgi:calcineurin-like phosphoesterase family protein
MANIFLISDTHFGHEKCCTTFKRNDGTPLRPFENAQEMDEEMVRRWNKVVREHDKVYHLGDVVIGAKHLATLSRLNGSKRLIRGNHDIFKTKDYLQYFKEIYGIRVLEDMVLTHVPLHPESITQRWRVNVHGHLHANRVTITKSTLETKINDPLYFSVCVEQIDYRPIELSELREKINLQFEEHGDDLNHAEYVHIR